MTPEERALIKALPNRLIGIIFGIILIVNSDPVSKAAPEDIEELVKTNMLLFGGVIVFLSFLRTMIEVWDIDDATITSVDDSIRLRYNFSSIN